MIALEAILTPKIEELRKRLKRSLCPTADIDDFVLLDHLSHGSFGTVSKVKHKKTQIVYALKAQKKKYILPSMAETEMKLQYASNFEFIVKLVFGFFQDDENVYSVMEFVPGGDFFDLLDSGTYIGEHGGAIFTAQVVLAFEYLHSANIIFRDFKPENVMINNDGYIKLTDFGLAKQLEKGCRTYSLCGTAVYMAPEYFLSKGYKTSVDWWALGVFTYALFCRQMPFVASSENGLLKKIMECDCYLPNDGSLSQRAVSFIEDLLQKKPERRLGITREGVKTVKNHEFFYNILWDCLYNKRYQPPVSIVLSNRESKRLRQSNLFKTNTCICSKSIRKSTKNVVDH